MNELSSPLSAPKMQKMLGKNTRHVEEAETQFFRPKL